MITGNSATRHSKSLWTAFAVALVIRLLALAVADIEMKPRGLEVGYLDATASLASGKGLLMWTPDSLRSSSAFAMMQSLEMAGTRLSKDNPYPPTDKGWLPATLHPAGYSVILWSFYEIGNASGMLLLAQITQAILDAVVCILLFVFARNIFSSRIGLYAAWIYAFLPSAIVLNLYFLPDSYARFFAILILSLASYTRYAKKWAMPAAGFAAGIAFHFRPEFLIWPFILWLCLVFDSRKILFATSQSLLALVCMLIAISPWTIWSYHSIGQPLLSTSGAGGAMYESLGEIPSNPWGIVLNDDRLVEDARAHGFVTAWAPDANRYYRDLWMKSVLKNPGFYATTVFTQRLPLAFIPPFTNRRARTEFDLAAVQRAEGLTKFEAVIRYPLETLKYRATELMMASISFLLLGAMLIAIVIERRNMRSMVWLIFPWLVTMFSMSLIKQIEARNMSVILVVQVVALSLVVAAWVDRRRG